MGPIRIKYLGLVRITRPTYVVLQSIAIALCVLCMAIGFLAVLVVGSFWPHWPPAIMDLLVSMFWVGLLAFPMECIEMYVMLRKFARAEAEQRASLAALLEGEPVPTVPASTAVQPSSNVPPPNTNIQP